MCLGWIESSSLCYIVGLLYMCLGWIESSSLCLGWMLLGRLAVHVSGLDRK